jgi:hypothetical protein
MLGSRKWSARICLANEFRQYLIEGLHLPLKGILWVLLDCQLFPRLINDCMQF